MRGHPRLSALWLVVALTGCIVDRFSFTPPEERGCDSSCARVLASNPGSGDELGTSVALSGDGAILAAAAPKEDSTITDIGGDIGAVYVFYQ